MYVSDNCLFLLVIDQANSTLEERRVHGFARRVDDKL